MQKLLPLIVVAAVFAAGLGLSLAIEAPDRGAPDRTRAGAEVEAQLARAAEACPQLASAHQVIDCAAAPCIVYERSAPGQRPLRDCASWPHHRADAISRHTPTAEITAYVLSPPGDLAGLVGRIEPGFARMFPDATGPPVGSPRSLE